MKRMQEADRHDMAQRHQVKQFKSLKSAKYVL